jgi:hypothetical protein
MPHWKKLMDAKDMLYAFDLDGRDVTVTITRVIGGELTGEQGRKTKKPIAHLAGTPKKLALNATNCTTIEQLTGTSDYEKWVGVRVTLFPTTTNFGGKTVDCIRVRPYPPKDDSKSTGKGGKPSASQLPAQMTAPLPPSGDPDVDAAAARDAEGEA